MKKLFLIPLLMLATSLQADSSKLQFNNGWIKQLPPVVPMRAGYVAINNPSEQTVEITKAHSDSFNMIELHESRMEDGMMKMVEQESLVIPAKGSLQLKPGSFHLMMMGLKEQLEVGDVVNVDFSFNDGTSKSIAFEVKP